MAFLATASAAATITSALLAAGGTTAHQIHEEMSFNGLIRDMRRAARKNPNVVKSGRSFYFFHADDFQSAEKTSAGATGFPRTNAENQRVTRLKPRDGWLWNDWELKHWDKSKRDFPKVEHLSTDRCFQLFHSKYTYGEIASNAQRQKHHQRAV